MARARNIKPGFYKNAELVECSVWARLIFPGLWILADRDGRLEDRPKQIKMELLPADLQDMNLLLQELEEHGFIVRYEAGGKSVIQVLNFDKHQNPHVKEAASTLPAPDEPGAKPGIDPMQARCKHGASTGPTGLIPSLLIPSLLKQERPTSRVPSWKPPEWMPADKWEAFTLMRKAKGSRAPFTEAARDGIVATLDKMRADGHDIGQVLQASVVNGWSGVFAPKAALPSKSQPTTELEDMFRRGAA